MVTRLLILAALLGGCEKRSELYCEKNPEDLAHCPSTDAPEVPQVMCNDNSMCTQGDKLLCNTASHVCVGCLSNADCTDPNKNNCDPGSGTCRGCVVHSDCASNVCLPDGTCGDDSNVIYLDADAGADTGDGTKAKPIKTWAKAIMLVSTSRKFVKLTGTIAVSIVIDTLNVIILGAPGSKIVGAMDPAIKVNKASAKIYDVEITCTGNINGITTAGMSSLALQHVYVHGCPKTAVDAADGFLGVTRSTIESNGDGLVTSSKVSWILTNNIIVRNGSASAVHGGVELGSLNATNRFEFNTVADNAAVGGLTGNVGGVNCPVSLTSSLEIPNNLIVGNTGGSGNVGGSCTTTGSAVDTDSTKWMFKAQATAPYDYHLTAASTMAIDMATTPTAIIDDVDGQLRPQGAQRDFGADEFKP